MNNHIDYISRNNQLEIIDSNGEVLSSKETKGKLDSIIVHDKGRSDSKKTYQIMFSTQGKNLSEDVLNAVNHTIKKEFPDNDFFMVVHQDTSNTHVHCVLPRLNNNFERIEINKRKLNKIKKTYNLRLNELGIKSYFLSETDKQKANIGSRQLNTNKVDKRKGNDEFEVIDYGHAKYKFDENGKDSFYIMLKTKNNVIKTHWSLGINDAIKSSNVKIGDKIKIKRTNKLDDVINNNKYVRSTWDIEKLNYGVRNTPDEFKVIDYGHAKYKFDENGKDSFYLISRDNYGNQFDLWNKELEGFIKNKNIKTGDVLKTDGFGLYKKNEPLSLKKDNAITKGSLKI